MKVNRRVELQLHAFLMSEIKGKWSASGTGYFTPGVSAEIIARGGNCEALVPAEITKGFLHLPAGFFSFFISR
jgi:hypothetical protein